MQTNDNLVILTHKINIFITLTTFLKKCKKNKKKKKKQKGLTYMDGGGSIFK